MRGLNILVGLLVAAMLAGAPALAQDDDKRKPPTKVTEKLSPQVYKQIEAAQLAMEAKDLAQAESVMNALKAEAAEGKLNDYEQAQMYNFLAAIHYEQGRTEQTIQDYIAILKLEAPPQSLRDSALFRLAQLYFIEEDYQRSIRLLDEWAKSQESVRPEAHMLRAQAYYQLEDYAASKNATIDALKEARRREQAPRENWLALLRACYYELGDYKSATRVLAELVERWPKASYYKQLSGMLGLMDSQKGQMLVMHAASVNGMLDAESEILNMARLYMAQDAPFPAIRMIEQGLENGTVEETADNLELLAQAMSLAKETEAQIPVLEKAARLSGEAKQYLYLGQAQIALYRWKDAARSLEKALDIGGLDRPGSVYLQLGTAYFNLKRFNPALQAFKEAGAFDDYRDQSRQWVRFIGQEIKRVQALREF